MVELLRSLALIALAFGIVGCAPAVASVQPGPIQADTAVPRSAGPVDTVAVPSPQPTPTLSTPGPGVASLLAHPPAPGESVEVDAYFSGAGAPVLPSAPPPPAGQVCCPLFPWLAALTDRPFVPSLTILNSICSNELPAGEPWLVAVTPEGLEPGVLRLPQLPYHVRLRGHLGDPALAHCPQAGRIFVVEGIATVYEENPPAAFTASSSLPPGWEAWPRYREPGLGYSLPVPPGWRAERLDDVTLALYAPEGLPYPMWVRTHDGETHYDQYDPASAPPLLAGDSFGVFQQGWASGERSRESQHLDGFRVDRRPGPGEREVAILFSGGGHTYELSLRYRTGFEAQQPLLVAYSAIVEGFRLDVAPGPSPTPPVRQSLGPGPFLSQAEALARVRQRRGEVELLTAQLVPEAEARNLAGACDTYGGHSQGVWVLTVRGTFEGATRTMRLFLDAVGGQELCGEEIESGVAP